MVQVALWGSRPVIYHDAADAAKREEYDLLHRLVVRAEVLRSNSRAVDQLLVCVHAIENNHRLAVVKDA